MLWRRLSKSKCRDKTFVVHALESWNGSRGIAPPILNFGFNGSELSTLRHGLFTREKGLKYPLIRSLDFLLLGVITYVI